MGAYWTRGGVLLSPGPKWRKKSIHFGIVYLLKKPDKSYEIPCLLTTLTVV